VNYFAGYESLFEVLADAIFGLAGAVIVLLVVGSVGRSVITSMLGPSDKEVEE
jgi:hypothetical protein